LTNNIYRNKKQTFNLSWLPRSSHLSEALNQPEKMLRPVQDCGWVVRKEWLITREEQRVLAAPGFWKIKPKANTDPPTALDSWHAFICGNHCPCFSPSLHF